MVVLLEIWFKEILKDIDIVAVGSGIELAKVSVFLKKPKVQVFKNYGTICFVEDTEIEFVGARKESYHLKVEIL
jgi:tRNA nucleotidyltransferase (CCA-adding enzyme)